MLKDNDLIEDLISPNVFTALGYTIVLNDDGGWIEKDGEKVIPIMRDRLKWLIDLPTLKCFNANVNNKVSSNTKDLVMSLHRRMGHASTKYMVSAVKAGSWIGCEVTPTDIEDVMKNCPCVLCILGKKNRNPIPKSVTDPKQVPIGYLVSGDIVGPVTPKAKDGSRYFFLFVDRRTSFYHVFTSRTKDGFITALKQVYDFYTKHGHTMRVFRSDSEQILISGDVAEFLNTSAVKQDLSLPYAHHQNLVERHVQSIVNSVTTSIHDQALLGPSFWDYCLFNVVATKNRSPNTKTDGLSPLSMVCGSPPTDLKREFPFPWGQPVAARIPKRTWRFDLKSEIGIYVGVSEGSVNGGLTYYPSTGAVAARADLVPLSITPEEFTKYANTRLESQDISIDDLTIEVPDILKYDGVEEPIKALEDPLQNSSVGNPNKEETIRADSPIKGTVSRRKVKRLLRELGVSTRSMTKLSALLVGAHKGKRNELAEALQGEDSKQWVEALMVEINSLLHVTESIVPEEPDPNIPYDLIYATTVLKKKLHADGSPDKYKVRIPVCGNQLLSKMDYNNPTYSPTVSMLTHTSMLQLAVHDRMSMATFDTVSAYLHQAYPDTLKPLYLKLPKQLAEACGLNPAQLYRVKKYLYGLPDAGRAYYLAYSTALEKHGYTKSFSDPCLFMRIDPSQNIRTYVWIHVDDTFVSSTCPEELQRFQTVMSSEFPMTANYDVNSHLGISIEHEPDGAILLRQPKLLHQILDEYTDPPSKSKYPAMTPSKLIDDDEVSSQDEDGIRHKYMRLLGQLMYLSNSRPDILTALSYASTKSINPSESDFQRLLQVVSYLRQTPDYGLRLFPKKDDDPGTLHLTARW